MSKQDIFYELLATFIVFVIAVLWLYSTAFPQTPQFASLSFYLPQKEDGSLPKYTCSGVLIHNGKNHDYVCTAGHAIEPGCRVVVRFLNSNTFFIGRKGIVIKEIDTAIVIIPKTGIGARRIAKTKPKVGDTIWLEGVPKGKFKTKVCKITSVAGMLKGIGDLEFLPRCEVGDSGGPLINKDGLVVGIATLYRHNGKYVGAGPNLVEVEKLINNIDEIREVIYLERPIYTYKEILSIIMKMHSNIEDFIKLSINQGINLIKNNNENDDPNKENDK